MDKKGLIVLLIVFISSSQLVAQNNLLGNWNGNRDSISSSGVDFQFVYTGEVFSNVNGGLTKGTDYLDNIDITATLDLSKIMGWKGAKLFSYVLGNNGSDPNERVGSLQGISNIATYSTWKLYQIWIEQEFFDSKLSTLFGLYDLNSEFDTRESSGIFINPSHGIGPDFSQSGKNGPSIFPNASLAARIKYTPTENQYYLLGIFDGVAGNPNNPNGTNILLHKNDGFLIAYEMGLLENGEEFQKGFGKYSLGGWLYTSNFEDLTEVEIDGNAKLRNDNYGVYFSAEKFLLSETENPEQGLSAFLRFGIANSNINILDYYLGAGINIIGLFYGRDEDMFGIAVANAHIGKKFSEINHNAGIVAVDSEIILEIQYSFKATQYLRVQPDLQCIFNPSGNNINNKAIHLGLRVEVTV